MQDLSSAISVAPVEVQEQEVPDGVATSPVLDAVLTGVNMIIQINISKINLSELLNVAVASWDGISDAEAAVAVEVIAKNLDAVLDSALIADDREKEIATEVATKCVAFARAGIDSIYKWFGRS